MIRPATHVSRLRRAALVALTAASFTTALPALAAPPATNAPYVIAATALTVGDTVAVRGTDGTLRLRSGAGDTTPIIDWVPEGWAVTIVAGPQADATGTPWYNVSYHGRTGGASARYLSDTAASQSPPPAITTPPPMPATAMSGPTATAATADARGAAIAALALRYLGTPYLWGGSTPAGWDCSGFVVYVVAQATGQTLPRTTQAQIDAGTPIAPGDIRAGDLVFFADTDGPGITHVGIALGDGRFIHARSPATGTVITSLADPYYESHFAGARRP